MAWKGQTRSSDDVAWEVVGVVADEGLSWNGAAEAFVYGTREQNPPDYLALVVRGTVDPAHPSGVDQQSSVGS
jgi:hypothetical protein